MNDLQVLKTGFPPREHYMVFVPVLNLLDFGMSQEVLGVYSTREAAIAKIDSELSWCFADWMDNCGRGYNPPPKSFVEATTLSSGIAEIYMMCIDDYNSTFFL